MDQTQQIHELRMEIIELRSELHRLDWWQKMLPLKVVMFGLYLSVAALIVTILVTNP